MLRSLTHAAASPVITRLQTVSHSLVEQFSHQLLAKEGGLTISHGSGKLDISTRPNIQ